MTHAIYFYNKKIIISPYDLGYKISPFNLSCCCHSTNSDHWNYNLWMYEKLIFCEKYNLSLTELVSQEYVATYEEGFNYETIDGRLSKHLISVLEFRFTHKKDALYFKMNWS